MMRHHAIKKSEEISFIHTMNVIHLIIINEK